jgi:DNA replication protein DnaC
VAAIKTANTATATLPEKKTCPFKQCDGSGYLITGDFKYKQCECTHKKREQILIEELFNAARVPRRFRNKNFDNFEQKLQPKALQVCKRYTEQFESISSQGKNGLFLFGPSGTGKSHLAFAILNNVLGQVSVVAGVVPELLDLLRPKSAKTEAEAKQRNTEAEKRLELLKDAELIILDDLGAERSSPWVMEKLFLIINARYIEQLPTVITSNIPLEGLEIDESGKPVRSWERITSRIMEMCYLIPMDGEDYRKR